MGAEKACPAIDRARETLRSQGNRLGPTNHYGPTLGVGRTLAGSKRHRKVVRDNLRCITKGTIRKVARRGGVRRLSYDIYDETRIAVKNRLQTILRHLVTLVESGNRKTVTTLDVVYVLKHYMRNPLYGFGD